MGDAARQAALGKDTLVRFNFDPPLKQFNFQIKRFTAGISDWTPPLHAAGELFKRQMVVQFETEGKASGDDWPPPQNPEYLKLKERLGAHKTGVLTGALRGAMIGGEGYSEEIVGTSASFGMSSAAKAAKYGAYFAGGTEKMPPRRIIHMTPELGTEYQKVIHGWLVEEAHHNGWTGNLSSVANAGLSDLSYQSPLSAL